MDLSNKDKRFRILCGRGGCGVGTRGVKSRMWHPMSHCESLTETQAFMKKLRILIFFLIVYHSPVEDWRKACVSASGLMMENIGSTACV